MGGYDRLPCRVKFSASTTKRIINNQNTMASFRDECIFVNAVGEAVIKLELMPVELTETFESREVAEGKLHDYLLATGQIEA